MRCVSQIALLALALSCLAPSASAEDKGVLAAAGAFAQGQQAELSGNNERAAELFELADRIAPTPEALRSATRARLAANQLSSAAGNAEELLRRYPQDTAARELAEQVLERARPELVRFTLECSQPCSVVVDGYAAGLVPLETQVVYVAPGSHELGVGFEGDLTRELKVQGAAGEARTVKVVKPAPQPAKTPRQLDAAGVADASGRDRRGRLSPVYFWVAAGATVAAGAVTIWSGLDLINARDDFKSNPNPTRSEFHDGENKDTRTSALIGVTSALAVSTAALAFFTDFKGSRTERPRSATVSMDKNGAQLFFRGRF